MSDRRFPLSWPAGKPRTPGYAHDKGEHLLLRWAANARAKLAEEEE